MLGFFGALFGFIVLILAVQLYRGPADPLGYGIRIIVLSLLGLAGGGFFLGTVLGVIGGTLATVFDPEPASRQRELGLRFNGQKLGTCANCGEPFDATRRACPHWETPLRSP